MKFFETSKQYSLNKSTYVNLRWIAYIGQLITIILVQFFFKFNFNYFICIFVVLWGIITNLFLHFKIKDNLLNNNLSTFYLSFDILQIGVLIFLTGGITNPFIFLIIIPAVFSSQYLHFLSSIILVVIMTIVLIFLSFFYYELPHPGELHFHAPNYYLYSIPLSIIIGLFFLVYFGFKFGEESRIRKKAYDKIQELMARENELLSLGAQAAAHQNHLLESSLYLELVSKLLECIVRYE